jgi:hypothetical protein
MKKIDLKNLFNQLSTENLNLVVDKKVIAGSDSGSMFTISGFIPIMGTWSFSDMWDNCK